VRALLGTGSCRDGVPWAAGLVIHGGSGSAPTENVNECLDLAGLSAGTSAPAGMPSSMTRKKREVGAVEGLDDVEKAPVPGRLDA
jgi:hypothetical protein